MPEVDKIKPLLNSVQNDFVATVNANPSLTDQELIKKFPELNEFAKLGVPVTQSISYLRQYHADTKSGKYQDIGALKNDYSADKFVSNQTPVQKSPTTQPKADPIDAVQNDFVATLNANPSLTDAQLLEKFPEIRTGWPNPQEGIDYLRSYYADAISGKYQDLQTLKSEYDLKKKASPELQAPVIEQGTTSENVQATSLQPSETESLQQPLVSGGSTLGSAGTGLASQSQIPDQIQPIAETGQQPIGPYKPGFGGVTATPTGREEGTMEERSQIKKFAPLDSYINDLVPQTKYNQVNDADTRNLVLNTDTGRPFGSLVSKEEMVENQRQKAIITGDVELSKELEKKTTEFFSSAAEVNKEKSHNAEENFKLKIATQSGIPVEMVEANKEEWAYNHKVKFPNGEDGLSLEERQIRDKYANSYAIKKADEIKSEYFDQLTAQLGDKAPEYWKKKSQEMSMGFVTPEDLEVATLKQKITGLESLEKRTVEQEIELKKYKTSLQSLMDEKVVGSDLFDKDGNFILNKKIEIKNQEQFVDSVNKYAAIYDGTDKGTITKDRDNAFFQYVYAKRQYDELAKSHADMMHEYTYNYDEFINNPKYKGYSIPKTLEEISKLEAYMEDRLSYFMGANRALLLNEDPGTGEEDNFLTGISEGFKEAVGIESQSESALKDHAIRFIQNAGYEATPEQLDKIGSDFWETAGRSVGASIPKMAEIGVNLFLTNKVAGVLQIPKLAQLWAGTNRTKQLAANLTWDMISQGISFSAAGESGLAGIGEGIGQGSATAIMDWIGGKNKFARLMIRGLGGVTGEVTAEYTGQFVDEFFKEGGNLQKATEATFGKTADEGIEKLFITALVAGIFSVPGVVMNGGNEKSFLFANQVMDQVKKSDSKSPIIEYAKENDFTKPPTEEEIAEKDEIIEKKENDEEVTLEEVAKAELTETREEFQKTKDIPVDAAPVIAKPEGKDTEYTFSEAGETGFVSEKELITKLDDEKFVQSVSEGKIGLNVVNPSPEVEAKIKEKFPENTSETKVSGGVSFDNAKEGDVITHNGVQVTVVSKTKSRGGADVVEVKQNKRTKEEIKKDALQSVFNRFASEYKNLHPTWADIEANHPSEIRAEIERLTELENSRTATYTIDAEQWNSEVETEIKEKFPEKAPNAQPELQPELKTKTSEELIPESTSFKDIKKEDIIPVSVAFKNEPTNDYDMSIAEKRDMVDKNRDKTSEQTVSIDDVTPTQNFLDDTKTASLEGDSKPVLFKTDKGTFVLDGHHRIASQVNQGKTSIDAIVIDFTKQSETKAEPKTTTNETKSKTETETSVLESEKIPAGEVEQKENKIKEASKKLAEKVRSGKIKISLDKFSTSPKPIIDAVINSALEAVALTIEANGTIAQAVADGMRVIQNSDWFKSLSQERKEEVQDQIAQQLTDQLEAESEFETEPVKKKSIKDVKTEKSETPGSSKTNPKNKAFAERLGTQTNLNQETKDKILKDSQNEVQNQKELLKQTTDAFNQIMKETDGNYEEVLKVADGNISAGHKELLYAHVMQYLANLEQSTDPVVSKAASNRLIELGRVIADRLNESGKQIAAMATVYKNFPMYEFYQKLAMIERMNSNTLDNTNNRTSEKVVTSESIKEEATRDIESIIKDIEDNFTELFDDARFEKIISKLQSKIDGKKRPRNLTDKKKQEIKNKKKAALDRFFGRKGNTYATIPGVQQAGAIIEYAAALIEEGFYRSKDIIADIKDVFNSNGANLTDKQISDALDGLKQFREILKNEEVTTRRDSFDEVMKLAIRQYLKEGLKISNMTMDQALVSSDANIKQIKQNVIESLKNSFNLTEQEAKSAIDAIDQVFREKAVQKLKKKFDKFYPAVSPKKAHQKKEVDKIADDVSLGALDTTFEFMNMAFQKYGLLDLNNPRVVNDIRSKAMKIANAPEGVLKNQRRKDLATYLHKLRGGYGFKDWLMSRFYADILSGPLTHLKNLKYNSVAIGLIAPLTQMYTTGANPISTWKEMRRSFLESDRKVAAHYIKTGDDFIDPNVGPKAYVDAVEFNLIKNGYSKLLNLASTRMLAASDMALTRPLSSAIYKNHVKAYLRTEKGLKGKELEKAASELMGYTEENVKTSSEQALQDIKDHYGFDPFTEDTTNSIKREAAVLLLLRTQERITENSGIEEKMGTDSWLDTWNGETLIESADKEAKNMALTGETLGTVGLLTSLLDKVTEKFPLLKFKVPFSRVIGNMLNLGIKWSPGVGALQAGSRYFINSKLSKKGMPTTSSSLLYLINRVAPDSVVDSKFMKSLNKEMSQRQAKRDFINAAVITAVQGLIYALMAKDDDDEGLVITGSLDPSFYIRGSITKGTGIVPWGVYYRNSNGEMSFLSEYKNSATGYALSFFGELSERRMQDDSTPAGMFVKSLYSSAFFSAEKPALTGLKEAFDFLTPTDKYGNVKILDEKGYSDAWSTWSGGLFNSVLTPNLFKQSNKIVEQVYGMDEKRATNWWQAMVKGLPFVNQDMLETQFDHFGRPIEAKVELGFLGVMGNAEKGYSMLEPNKVDPYYELFTDRGATPQWFTDTEIPIYTQNKAGNYTKNDEGQKTRISKYEGHVLNILIGQYKKELIDSEVEYDMNTGKETYGLDAWREMDDEEFTSKMRKLNSEARDAAYKYFFENYRQEESGVSNEEKNKKYLKVNN